MKRKFKVTATRVFEERGVVEIEAFDEDDARDQAREDMDMFSWDHGTLEEERVDTVEEIADET